MGDANDYRKELDAIMAEVERRERARQEAELTEKLRDLLQRGLAVKPRLTGPDMERIIKSGYSIKEIETVISHREHPND